MKVLHVTPAFVPAYRYGGPIQAVYHWGRYLSRKGSTVRILTTDANGPTAVLDVATDCEIQLADGLRVRYCHRLMRESTSPAFLKVLPSYVRWADIVHLSGVYSFPTIPTLLVCKMLGKPVVWSPHGMLQRWEGSTRTALKTMWELVCRGVAPKRLLLHLTSNEEAEESLAKLPGLKTTVIPYGVEIPEKVDRVHANGLMRLLFLGRLHPKKGIDNLLAACKLLNDGLLSSWSLTIAGTGGLAYEQSLRILIWDLAINQQVKMIGEVTGTSKEKLFENSDLLIMPSYTENFGMVVTEALAHGVPVIASRGTPWRGLEEVGCGLWVENDPESLALAIKRISELPVEEMGLRGREWMMKEFECHLITGRMLQAYQKFLAS